MITGSQLREDGTAAVIAADAAVHRSYGDLVHEVLDELIDLGDHFTAEDIRVLIQFRYPTAVAHHPNLLPAVIGAYASAGRIRAVAMTKTTRASRRASRNLVWRAAK